MSERPALEDGRIQHNLSYTYVSVVIQHKL